IKTKFLVIINVSFFSRINFLYGYEYGNEFIKEIALFLENLAIKEETKEAAVKTSLYALYGAEFATIITDEGELDGFIEAIKKRFSLPWNIQGLEQYYQAAIGTVEIKPEDTSDKIIYKATMSCKYSKRIKTSKAGYAYDAKMDPFSMDIQIEYQLRRAVISRLDSFKVRYQPIVDCSTGKIVALEALCSWFDDEIGFVMPNDFIGFAEYLGLIDIIDNHVLRTATHFAKKLHDMGFKIKISANLSAKSLFNDSLVKSIEEIIEETELAPNYICLEITESETISNLHEALKQLQGLKNLGITISLDDFGIGYSSLGRLKEIPADYIKIDRSFIMKMHRSEYDLLFIKTIAKLGRCANMKIICEGVETLRDFEEIRNLGSDYVQGYLFSKPVYEEEALQKITDEPVFNLNAL
ncbi:MAG: bifunctional diguanylate cyclase/phosphodiesterase, partial [Defluviitaleaceae bacterium]|nr:bifunctional diguanylate cyclase/phosphodiesterase [Defluviitaleaceae bacterium]